MIRRQLIVIGVFFATWVLAGPALPDGPPQKAARPTGSFAIRAARVYTGSNGDDWALSPGVIIVRDGRIAAVGRDLAIAADLPLLDLKDAVITPGLIAAATALVPPHSGDESLAAGYRAIDAFDAYGDHSDILAGGVTTVHLNPGGHRLMTGQGAVVRLGGSAAGRVLRDSSDLTITLGDPVFGPPRDVTYQTPASSDVAIPPAVRQRPDSRLGQIVALEEALAAAEAPGGRDVNRAALADLWRMQTPLRVQVQRGADIDAGLEFLKKHRRAGYLVGGAQAHLVADRLYAAKVPVVYEISGSLRSLPADLGYDPDVLEADIRAVARLRGLPLAIAGPAGGSPADLRLAAMTAARAGLSPREVIEAVTRVPAEILGVADRVGRLAPGMDADFAVFSGEPLATTSHALLVYVGGEVAFEAPKVSALVVKAGTIWVDEKTQIANGAVLVENGKISAVGRSVPHPPFARVIDAGPGGFVTPGLIDAFGHLGLDGDRSPLDADVSPASIAGVPDVTERRVARAGITTVMTAPYAAGGQGSQVAAIRTGGSDRDVRVVSKSAAVYFDLRSSDPLDVQDRLEKRLKSGKEYVEKWQKYEKELAEWKEKKAKGELPDAGSAKTDSVKEAEAKADPITGTWEVTLSGGPIPEPQTATMKLRLIDTTVEGRMMVPGQPEEAKIKGTFDGKHLSGKIEVETPFGHPSIEADLIEEDKLKGTVAISDITINVEATRTDKSAVEFTVTRRKTHGKDGEPLPPPIDEGLEPLKAVLEKKIPVLVAVRTAPQIAAALKVAKDFAADLVLLDADEAHVHASELSERGAGVVVGRQVVRQIDDHFYHQADDLSRRGIPIAFQSDAEDAARALPMLAMHAVERGLSADAALAAFTTHASRMYKLDGQLGSLQPGRLGDLVIFSGHPFEAATRVERVIINGEEVE